MAATVIVVTSGHGDHVGDHGLGERTFFHDAAAKVPLIIHDPSAEADATRGRVTGERMECTDPVPTFLEVAGDDPASVGHILAGHSLLRDWAICEYHYSTRPPADALRLETREARGFMIADRDWKPIHVEGQVPPDAVRPERRPAGARRPGRARGASGGDRADLASAG